MVGVDHVSIGADTSSNPGLLQRYDDFTNLVEAMLRGGFSPADTAKIVGGTSADLRGFGALSLAEPQWTSSIVRSSRVRLTRTT